MSIKVVCKMHSLVPRQHSSKSTLARWMLSKDCLRDDSFLTPRACGCSERTFAGAIKAPELIDDL